ncbi:hypothetical protein PBI_SOUPS_7 [Gordonia phage Soups]|uniref:Minor tail protein gp31 C-terminal domain-containing protein n=1 Tax=Gordonia phage Soups TaxID=1838079 RepID=A0A160DG31_9CAUD|nr:tail protein [Gordonia phage Soups]ANA86945.1 hypothetical protein PBI_SOUPS_7 [Gordonia phage Soups]
MKLRGYPPEDYHRLSYLTAPQGSIIGSLDLPVTRIISVPGNPGPPGEDGSVLSVNGREGHVEVTKDDLELDQVDNTSDMDKPVSDDQASALSQKVSRSSTINSAYGTDNLGADRMWLIASGATGGAIALRGTGGVLTVGAPTADNHASTRKYVDDKVAGLVSSAPATLDTLDELAAALGDDPNFATTVATQIGTKASTTYVDTQLNLKADKTTVTSSLALKRDRITTPNSVYATDAAGNQIAGTWSATPDANTIAVRDGSGRLTTASAASGTDAVNKNQLDAGLATKAASGHTHAGMVTGTGVTNIVALTQSEYNALSTKDPNTVYLVKP